MLVKAKLRDLSRDQAKRPTLGAVSDEGVVEVLFNPTEYGIARGASYTELQVPGLATPILQFVRGEAEILSVELFPDGSKADKPSVEEDLEKLRRLVTIDRELHAPPVVAFEWGGERFVGVVTSLKEKYTLFDESGRILRARVTLALSVRPEERTKEVELVLDRGLYIRGVVLDPDGVPVQSNVFCRGDEPRLRRGFRRGRFPPLR